MIVELDSVGAGFLEQAGITRPSSLTVAIQAGDNGDVDGFLRCSDQIQMAISSREDVELRKGLRHLGVTVLLILEDIVQKRCLAVDLFFEQ